MRAFSANRTDHTADEFWLVQHRPVYTLGRNGKKQHILNPGDIPIVEVDRGGQVTYHGPGQIVLYLLLDMHRNRFGVRQVVSAMEAAVVRLLEQYDIASRADPNAPGVYVAGKKIASLGLRISRGKSYHGLALNVDMDLQPFLGINPCGYEGLEVTQIKDFTADVTIPGTEERLLQALLEELFGSRIENQRSA